MIDIIKRNTTVPTKQSQTFENNTEKKIGVSIDILEGERKHAEDNNVIGNLNISSLIG